MNAGKIGVYPQLFKSGVLIGVGDDLVVRAHLSSLLALLPPAQLDCTASPARR